VGQDESNTSGVARRAAQNYLAIAIILFSLLLVVSAGIVWLLIDYTNSNSRITETRVSSKQELCEYEDKVNEIISRFPTAKQTFQPLIIIAQKCNQTLGEYKLEAK
jgi:hypothetical protein